MKKFTLIALAIMASATSFAQSKQTVLWDGEDKAFNTDGGMWNRCSPTVVENPDKNNDVNKSEKCLQFTINGNNPDYENRAIAWGLGENNGIYQDRVLSLKIRKANSGNVKIDLECSDGTHVYTAKWYDGRNTWQKLYFAFPKGQVFDNPKAITIFANNDAEEGEQVVYIDDITLEAQPMVDGKVLSALEAEGISGNVTLTGTWLNFTCKNPVNWTDITYNSYQDFNNKCANTLTSVNITGADAHDVDINQFFEKNPNTIVYANANDTYSNHANVVIAGKAAAVTLNDAYAFNIPDGFDATTVTLKRNLRGGINSFVLPFWVNAEDLKSTSLATYSSEKSENSKNVVFEKVNAVDANFPFITVGYSKAEGAEEEEVLTWSNKGFVALTTEFTAPFKGVYAPQSANGKFGINGNGDLQIGGTDAKIKAFHAYYEAPEGQAAPAKISFEGEATGINSVAAATVANGAVYDLSGRRVAEKLAGASLVKGIYVVNGKKVVVK